MDCVVAVLCRFVVKGEGEEGACLPPAACPMCCSPWPGLAWPGWVDGMDGLPLHSVWHLLRVVETPRRTF